MISMRLVIKDATALMKGVNRSFDLSYLLFSKGLARLSSDIRIRSGDKTANAKSGWDIALLMLNDGAVVTMDVSGDTEVSDAVKAFRFCMDMNVIDQYELREAQYLFQREEKDVFISVVPYERLEVKREETKAFPASPQPTSTVLLAVKDGKVEYVFNP